MSDSPSLHTTRSLVREASKDRSGLAATVGKVILEQDLIECLNRLGAARLEIGDLQQKLDDARSDAAGWRAATDATTRRLIRCAEEIIELNKAVQDGQRAHADLLRVLQALHPTTDSGAYELLAELHAKWVGQ